MGEIRVTSYKLDVTSKLGNYELPVKMSETASYELNLKMCVTS